MIAYFAICCDCLFFSQLLLLILLSVAIAYFYVCYDCLFCYVFWFLTFLLVIIAFFLQDMIAKIERGFRTKISHMYFKIWQANVWLVHITVVIYSEGNLRAESWYIIAIPGIWLKSAVAVHSLRTINEMSQHCYKVSRWGVLLSVFNFASNTYHERHLDINLVSWERA
jgi:hypothetical protein